MSGRGPPARCDDEQRADRGAGGLGRHRRRPVASCSTEVGVPKVLEDAVGNTQIGVLAWVPTCHAVVVIEVAKDVLTLVLRGVLPYPDLVRRVRVRRAARSLIPRTGFPSDDLVTGSDLAQLALLRVLDLQRQTRRAVRGRHREGAVQLARSAMDVAIVGIWCLREPRAVAIMREAQLRSAKDSLAGLLIMTGLLPEHVLEKAMAALGPAKVKLPPVRNMAKTIDTATGGALEAEFYQRIYDPLSAFFVHANAWSLSRYVGRGGQRKTRPTMPWARRSPVRVADACVGLMAAALATDTEAPARLFMDYTIAHGKRVLPPFGVLLAKTTGRTFSLRSTLQRLREASETKKYLAGPGRMDSTAQRETRVRALFNYAFADPDLPNDAIAPAVDHFVAVILDEYGPQATPDTAAKLGDAPVRQPRPPTLT
jgi:hypothetical protein